MLAGPLARPLDLFDDGAVAAAGGVSWEAVLWTFSPAHLQPGAVGGAHILLELIRRRRDLRERFPRALSDGATGRFAAWVRSRGLLFGLGPDKTAWIDAAFASDLGAASRQHLLSRTKRYGQVIPSSSSRMGVPRLAASYSPPTRRGN